METEFKINLLIVLAVLMLVMDFIIVVALIDGKPIILIETRNQSCRNEIIDTSWEIKDDINCSSDGCNKRCCNLDTGTCWTTLMYCSKNLKQKLGEMK